jgi:hypothetical protein
MVERVGIVGVPPLAVIAELNRRGDLIVDLDEPQVAAPMDQTATRIPRVYCAILRTVVLNCLHLRLDRVYIDVGPGKCDGALHVAEVLADMLEVPVIPTRSVQSAAPHPALASCTPVCGFWGVPPRDFSLLAPFPDATHVFGWTRCMENKTPADLKLERQFDPDIPTVFFAQSFCAKSALAQHLAAKHPRALAIDCDVTPGSSTRAKIEAFLELAGIEPTRRSAA